jgi:hypothetical protein
MWESRLLLARFPRGSWEEGEASLAFHAFHSPVISTALSFRFFIGAIHSPSAWFSACWFFLACSTR